MSGLYFLHFRNIDDTRGRTWKWSENRKIGRNFVKSPDNGDAEICDSKALKMKVQFLWFM